jgi:hypothetical protein
VLDGFLRVISNQFACRLNYVYFFFLTSVVFIKQTCSDLCLPWGESDLTPGVGHNHKNLYRVRNTLF